MVVDETFSLIYIVCKIFITFIRIVVLAMQNLKDDNDYHDKSSYTEKSNCEFFKLVKISFDSLSFFKGWSNVDYSGVSWVDTLSKFICNFIKVNSVFNFILRAFNIYSLDTKEN